jgi:hypothetical protein
MMNLKTLITVFFVLAIFSLQAQNTQNTTQNEQETSVLATADDGHQNDPKIKRLSIGLKLGVPNLASVGLQYTLPILNNHFAPYFEYSSYAYNDSATDGDFKYTEFGTAFYFGKSGKGLYLGLGKSSLKVNAAYNSIDLGSGRTGSGSTKIALNTTNLKLGLKTGGRVYFRLEVGYGFGDLPKTVSILARDNDNPAITENTTEEIPEIPGVSESGLVIGNIGFGISF